MLDSVLLGISSDLAPWSHSPGLVLVSYIFISLISGTWITVVPTIRRKHENSTSTITIGAINGKTTPFRLLGFSIGLTLLSVLGMGFGSYHTHKSITSLRENALVACELVAQAITLDDSRTEALQRAIQTNARTWQNQYAVNIGILNVELAKIGELYNNLTGMKSLTDMKQANDNLLDTETKILELLRHGKRSLAASLLDGAQYQQHKQLFADTSNALSLELNRFTKQKLQEFSDDIYYSLFAFILLLPVQVLIWAFTLTGLRHWRRELLSARKVAEEASRSKGDFLANMSHELRTPMNGIIGLTQLLADSEKLPAQEQLIDAIGRSSESLLFLLNDILDFSKIEAGQLHLEETPFNLRESLKAVINLLSVIASKKGFVSQKCN